jgi:hypothetical protein
MAKQKEVKYGIVIVKPWSAEMYAHNAKVMETVKQILFKRIADIAEAAANNAILYDEYMHVVSDEVKSFQKALTSYGFGRGNTYAYVIEKMVNHVQNLENWSANEIVNRLNLELEYSFIGFKN